MPKPRELWGVLRPTQDKKESMSLRSFQCPAGEPCYAEECVSARTCMHMDEIPQAEPGQVDPDAGNRVTELKAEVERLKDLLREHLIGPSEHGMEYNDFQRITAEVQTLRQDKDRMDWMEQFITGGLIETAFEVDGGIHLTLSPVGGEVVAYRDKNCLRQAVDEARASGLFRR